VQVGHQPGADAARPDPGAETRARGIDGTSRAAESISRRPLALTADDDAVGRGVP
jgi:hypothetical protein